MCIMCYDEIYLYIHETNGTAAAAARVIENGNREVTKYGPKTHTHKHRPRTGRDTQKTACIL